MKSPLHSEHMPRNNWWEYNYFIYNGVIFQNHSVSGKQIIWSCQMLTSVVAVLFYFTNLFVISFLDFRCCGYIVHHNRDVEKKILLIK